MLRSDETPLKGDSKYVQSKAAISVYYHVGEKTVMGTGPEIRGRSHTTEKPSIRCSTRLFSSSSFTTACSLTLCVGLPPTFSFLRMARDILLIFLLVVYVVHAQTISINTPVPPLQWINLSNVLQGTAHPPPLKDAAIGYDETRFILTFNFPWSDP